MAEAPAAMARHGMTDEVEQTHQGEEGLACHLARAEGAVQLKGREGRGRGGEAEIRLVALRADSHEGVEEREGARHVPRRAKRLGEKEVGGRSGEGGSADLTDHAGAGT